jgi:hypothetical protein
MANEFQQKTVSIFNPMVIVMRLLLIEDDLKIATFISKGLKEAGFVIEHTNGRQCWLADGANISV